MDTVVVDGELTPQQSSSLEERTGARVIDRQRLVLEILARESRFRRAQLQVERTRLRYRVPWVPERTDEGALNRYTESGTRYDDLLDCIDELERKLDDLPHWLVELFRGTLSTVDHADAVVLVVAAQPVEELRRRHKTVLDSFSTGHPPLAPVLNKTDPGNAVQVDPGATRHLAFDEWSTMIMAGVP